MPRISGQLVVILTVTDLARSEAWYSALLDAESYRHDRPNGEVGQVTLHEPQTGLELCLVTHGSSTGEPFNEAHTGLDHLEFVVPSRGDLDEWAAKLDELGIAHSGVKQPSYTPNAMITFRDPDSIQLEFFWAARDSVILHAD